MTDVPEKNRPVTASLLYDHIRRFVDDNRRSSEPEIRWLASKLEAMRPLVCNVVNGRLEPAERAEATAFRAAEIEKEIAGKRREVESLERELKRTMGLTLQGAA